MLGSNFDLASENSEKEMPKNKKHMTSPVVHKVTENKETISVGESDSIKRKFQFISKGICELFSDVLNK